MAERKSSKKASSRKKAPKKTAKKTPSAKKQAAKSGPKRKPTKVTGKIGSTDLAAVASLVDLMRENDLSELEISDGSKRVTLKRGASVTSAASAPAAPIMEIPSVTSSQADLARPTAAEAPASATPAEPAEKLLEVTSPMVGTFYAASSPDSDPFVAVGDRVSADSVVCIVEAMKVMNEIKAECSGTIAEICVENAQPVEFGQVLFRVKPA